MPRKPDAVAIGRMTCERDGERAAVYQSTRGYLYTRCPVCKCNQANSVERQVFVWQHMEPIAGAVIERPRNVPESAGPIGGALTGEAPPVTVIEPEKPVPVPASEEAPVPIGAGSEGVPEPAPIGARKSEGGAAPLIWLALAGLGIAMGRAMKTTTGAQV